MKRQGSARKTSKSNGLSTSTARLRLPTLSSPKLRFVVCIDNGGYVDLEPLKVYRVRHDRKARSHGMLRVVDASGEDYLYPARYFSPIQATAKLFDLAKLR
jgi:hypothetical protein